VQDNPREDCEMKSRRDCKCPCHHGGIAVHVVPCFEGIATFVEELYDSLFSATCGVKISSSEGFNLTRRRFAQ